VETLRSNLKDVDRALERIDDGTYGLCERCGKPIDPDRLEARPWALLCMDCKQKR
jgi:RNA polymerase-binding protein DksA